MPRRSNGARDAAANPATAVVDLIALASSPDKYVLSTVAANPALPAAHIAELSASDDKYVRCAAAKNPSCPPGALHTLASDSDDYVRSAVARHRGLADETAHLMASTLRGAPDRYIVRNLAENPATPDAVLLSLIASIGHDRHVLASDLSAGLKYRNRPTQTKTVEIMRFDGRRSQPHLVEVPIERAGRFSQAVIEAMVDSEQVALVNLAVAQPDAPQRLLLRVAGWDLERWKWTINRIADNPGAGPTVLNVVVETGDNDLLLTINRRPDLPESLILALMAHGGPKVQAEVCHRDEETLAALASSNEESCRLSVARALDGATDPHHVCVALINDPARVVRLAAASRASVDILALLHEQGALALEGRLALAERTTDSALLERLSAAPEPTVRRRVVRNTACPLEALLALAADTDATVRRYSAERVTRALEALS